MHKVKLGLNHAFYFDKSQNKGREIMLKIHLSFYTNVCLLHITENVLEEVNIKPLF